jgi:hypothetical protein
MPTRAACLAVIAVGIALAAPAEDTTAPTEMRRTDIGRISAVVITNDGLRVR